MRSRARDAAAGRQVRCPNCHTTRVRKAWAPAAMLGFGVVCLAAGVVSGVVLLRAAGTQPYFVLSLLLLCAGVVSLVRWNGFRGRTYYECRTCGYRWARRYIE